MYQATNTNQVIIEIILKPNKMSPAHKNIKANKKFGRIGPIRMNSDPWTDSDAFGLIRTQFYIFGMEFT